MTAWEPDLMAEAAEGDERAATVDAMCEAYVGSHGGVIPSRMADVLAVIEPRVQAAALRAAAREIQRIRENGLDPGMGWHPTSEYFDRWLRERAAALAPEGKHDVAASTLAECPACVANGYVSEREHFPAPVCKVRR